VHAPHRRRLRDGPEVTGGPTARQTRDVDRQIGERAPEVVQRNAEHGGQAAVVDVDVAVDRDVVRRRAEAGDLRVVADLEDEWIRGAAVRAGLEEQCVPVAPHLVVDLLRGDRVDRRLDLAGRHARIEDQHVRAEARCGGSGARRGCATRAGKRDRRDDDESETPGHTNIVRKPLRHRISRWGTGR
jgi:hypothetical protein